MARYPEAKAFALEALAETKLSLAPFSDTTAKLSSLSQSISQQATQLLSSLEQDVSTVEQLYSGLSCVVSEYRHLLRSLAEAPAEPEPRVKRQRRDVVQWLPNELVLSSLQFDNCLPLFRVFPRLSRSTNQLSVSSPESLGVLRLSLEQFGKLTQLWKPRCIGSVDTTRP